MHLGKNQLWRDTSNGDVLAIDAVLTEPVIVMPEGADPAAGVGFVEINGLWVRPEYRYCVCRLYTKRKLFGIHDLAVERFADRVADGTAEGRPRYVRIRFLRLRAIADKFFGGQLYPIPRTPQTTRTGDVTSAYDDVPHQW